MDVKIPPKVELTEVKPLIAAEIIHFNFHIMLSQSVIDWESRHLDILAAGKLRIESLGSVVQSLIKLPCSNPMLA